MADPAPSPVPLSTRRQLELMRSLQRAATERHDAELAIAAAHRRGVTQADSTLAAERDDAELAYQQARAMIDGEHTVERGALVADYERERSVAQGEYHSLRTRATSMAATTARQAKEQRSDEAWLVLTQFDAVKGRPKAKLDELAAWVQQRRAELSAIVGDSLAIAASRGVPETANYAVVPDNAQGVDGSTASADDDVASLQQLAQQGIDAARGVGEALYSQWLPSAAGGPLPLGAFAGLATIALPLAGFVAGWDQWLAYTAALGVATAGGVATLLATRGPAQRQTQRGLDEVGAAAAVAQSRLDAVRRLGVDRAKREAAELRERRDRELADLGFRLEQLVGEVAARAADELGEAGKLFPAMLAETRAQHTRRVAELDSAHEALVALETRKRDKRLAEASRRRDERVREVDAERDAAWQRMFERWFVAYDDCRAALRDMRTECQRLFPDFAETDYGDWPAPTECPDAIQFGWTSIDLGRVKHGLSTDERLAPPETLLATPALMTLSQHPTMLVTASGEGRRAGVEVLRDAMLRFLTAMPPGKVRFTILDPVGLGDNFQAFMHLADSDELLIAGRIWSEPRDIEEQLGRLTNHMETVLQKYLRSEYETIHEYNAQAGEVAEPFQVLVVAGFPTNFSETAGRRLLSLVTGGPRCGVYTLLGVDAQQRLPTGLQLDDLKQNAVWLDWDPEAGGRFVWRYPAYERLPLELPAPLPSDRAIDTIRKAGEAAKAAVRVEVPFSIVAPKPGALWAETCASELRVPLGRAGANRLQYVRLGKGTSQHLLVAGKTGSGKSTFLHALVTSAALSHSPDEVEFYLIDFKKGVEFKSYATHRLPHARVIAIESEREFGLSVLERLDDELKSRGEKFRTAGVQNLADYREARPREKTPRILLIIDEFQELFVEDDRLAQESSLLLDRLVRQGRAFGVHVVLGTQTLAGAYSLARSTLGQIAIRVALECSEADAHLILNDERNTAARFLSRPGEAIYNAQNGLVTANEPFQVVWLPDRERAAWLDRLDDYRHERDMPRPEAVVFEGNAPADPATNEPLVRLLAGDPSPRAVAPRAWLGAAVAIKPPAYAEFHRAPGSNLLVVGSEEPAALGLLTAAAVSLAANRPAKERTEGQGPRLIVLDGSHPGEAADGVWKRVVEAIGAPAVVRDASGVTATLGELAAELAEREAQLAAGSPPAWPVFLVLHNAGRFRELRKRDDDYSFASFGDSDAPRTKRPDQQLADLLKNGPAVGLHCLVWCDSFNSAMRLFDRAALREFALRVALQMSAADSSNLIDTPAASDLNQHRALLYSDETGRTEKFRPYAPPTAAWLDRVAAAMG
ncbi:MAG: FtsK/SpoIIIE domain-containing protein [Lacipirellulaceae bacterium]